MKKIGEIMKEMGFREDAPDSLKEAFVRHLIKASTGVTVEPGPNEKKSLKTSHKSAQTQLEFDLSGDPNTSNGKKVS